MKQLLIPSILIPTEACEKEACLHSLKALLGRLAKAGIRVTVCVAPGAASEFRLISQVGLDICQKHDWATFFELNISNDGGRQELGKALTPCLEHHLNGIRHLRQAGLHVVPALYADHGSPLSGLAPELARRLGSDHLLGLNLTDSLEHQLLDLGGVLNVPFGHRWKPGKRGAAPDLPLEYATAFVTNMLDWQSETSEHAINHGVEGFLHDLLAVSGWTLGTTQNLPPAPSAPEIDREAVVSLAKSLTQCQHPLVVDGHWLSLAEVFSLFCQACQEGKHDLIPFPVIPLGLGVPLMPACQVTRREIIDWASSFRKGTELPGIIRIGPVSMEASGMLMALANCLKDEALMVHIPAGPLPRFYCTRKDFRELAIHDALEENPPFERLVNQAISLLGWIAKPRSVR